MLRGGFLIGGLLAGRAADRADRHRRAGVGARRATRFDGPLGIRASRGGRAAGALLATRGRCRPGGSSSPTRRRRWRCCSASSRRDHEPRARTRRLTLFAVQVAGVPDAVRRGGAVDARARSKRPGAALAVADRRVAGRAAPVADRWQNRRVTACEECESSAAEPVRAADGRSGLAPSSTVDERAARASLRAQIARLERELSQRSSPSGFPHIAPRRAASARGASAAGAPRLLEPRRARAHARPARRARCRTAPAGRAERAEHERRARELLERMKLEPGRYKFVRLPVRDLGRGRLRRVGGAPAPRPDRHARRLVAGQALIRLSVTQGVALQAWPRSPQREHRRQRAALTVGHRADRLLLGHRDLGEELAAARLTPAALAHQQVGDGHALGLPRAVEDHLGDVDLVRSTTRRLSSARARRTWLARSSARMYWGPAGAIVAVAFMMQTLPVAAAGDAAGDMLA